MPNMCPIGLSRLSAANERATMTTAYTVPDNPTDPEAAALELIVRLPADILHTVTATENPR
jgi:hypothetical protein